jgi:exonuclease VII small subunit
MDKPETGINADDILHMLSEHDSLKVLYYIVNSEHHFDKYTEFLTGILNVFREIRDEKPEGSNERKTLETFVDKLENVINSLPNPYAVLDSVVENVPIPNIKPGTGNPQRGTIQNLVDEKRRGMIRSLMKEAENEYNEYKNNLMEIVKVLEELGKGKGSEEVTGFTEKLKTVISNIPSPFEVLVTAYNEMVGR